MSPKAVAFTLLAIGVCTLPGSGQTRERGSEPRMVERPVFARSEAREAPVVNRARLEPERAPLHRWQEGEGEWRERNHRWHNRWRNHWTTSIFIGGFGYPYGYGYDPYGYGYYPYAGYGYAGYGYPGYGYGYGGYYSGYAAPPPPSYGARSRTSGSVVVEVQRRLARAGLYRGPIDGIIGSGTRRAIRAYERAHGLPVDGRIDAELLATMGLA